MAEIVIRNKLSMPDINSQEHPPDYDVLLPSSVKVDVKCRGGALPFKEEYLSSDDIPREAKHNFFARQIYDENLKTDIYLMTHLETPSNRILPGTKRQRKWILYVCGWVSKGRVLREGVYLPRGSLTEQGKTWFTYRGQEIEFYNKNLNGLENLEDILKLEPADMEKDKRRKGDLNLTSVDAIRIAFDLVGRGLLDREKLDFIRKEIRLTQNIKPILHPNQYTHLLKWLNEKGELTKQKFEEIKKVIIEEKFSGI